MNLSEHVEIYSDLLLSERGYAITSVKSYRWALRAAVIWLRSKTPNRPKALPPEVLTTEQLRKYFLFLSGPAPKGKGYRPRTLRVHWAALKGFCTYLVEKEVIPDLRFPRVKMPAKDPVQRRLLSDAQMAALEEAVERIHDPFRCVLARALLQTMLSCALRVSELRALKVSDLSLSQCWLLVELGKGNKSRKCALSDKCIEALREWLAIRPEPFSQKGKAFDWLWMRSGSHRIGPGGLVDLFTEVEMIAGFARGERNLLAHSVRHNAATRLYRNTGHDIEAVRLFLGHSALSTTQDYLDYDEQRMLQIRNLTALDATPEVSDFPPPPVPQKPKPMLISVKKPDLQPTSARQSSGRLPAERDCAPRLQVERFSRPRE